jgi:hypothetical protein
MYEQKIKDQRIEKYPGYTFSQMLIKCVGTRISLQKYNIHSSRSLGFVRKKTTTNKTTASKHR